MKILDTMTVIAFLKEMKFPDGITLLSKEYRIIIPMAVYLEVKKSPEKELLKELIDKKAVKIVQIDSEKVAQLKKEIASRLGDGECEAIIFARENQRTEKICLVSDDKFARGKFDKVINFKWTERLMDIMLEKELISKEVYKDKMNNLTNSPFFSRSKK